MALVRIIPLAGAFLLGMLSMSCEAVQPGDLLKDPSPEEWKALERYSGSLTRAAFEERLKNVFDPSGSLSRFVKVTDQEVRVFATTNQSSPVAVITFAQPSSPPLPEQPFASPAPPIFSTAPPSSNGTETAASVSHPLAPTPSASPGPQSWGSWIFSPIFFSWAAPQSSPIPSPSPAAAKTTTLPLTGLRVVIDPADIGGAWASMEDRSTLYPGFGRIQEGDLNLLVSKILAERLKLLGAKVFVTRESAAPATGLSVVDVQQVVPQVMAHHPYLLSKTFRSRTLNVRKSSPIYQKIAAEVLLTKNLEARARAEKSRAAMQPDITIVLQFDATPGRHLRSLPKINRNILFISGAYTAAEVNSDPRQRLRLLTKLFENVTPTEIRVALAISNHLVELTGFPPVLYGNSRTTRSIAGNPYVVARNLLLNREHDGPVVVTEPYFMNQPETLQRLLAGDFDGSRLIAGKKRVSIFREYASAVADGLVDAYGK
jgi:N-acetylmuramoyl-L-alanine amidase